MAQISHQSVFNKASPVRWNFGAVILNWLRFNHHSLQYHVGEEMQVRPKQEREGYTVCQYMLPNICNMDQTLVLFEYIYRKTNNLMEEKCHLVQSSKYGWDKR